MDDEKLLMGDICQNSGFFQLEPGPNKKAISLPLRDEDYTEDIKEVQAYLDKLRVSGLGVETSGKFDWLLGGVKPVKVDRVRAIS
ncbi:Pyrophosphate--fructose 6-phosphate 1-phosphotransferase subunit alpha [Camellia lanceoleosa]|uniref:Pyrophosphate--fructose 6-phosphate 1-phosphotransferase subunit alpha n=1 Tax=Camellia lanceoleosa TaxID=1840588 RepID=A0ACC0IQ46_9ERIC|nr:Pyrophosphate--fructose 6-phosphate 1-phosphotransferase subunit alpha [Camellia lanceoleosa]